MSLLRSVPVLTDAQLVESYFRIVAKLPWREQTCPLCLHPRHAKGLCACDSDDDPTARCGCGWRS